jgi:hypothetical protein
MEVKEGFYRVVSNVLSISRSAFAVEEMNLPPGLLAALPAWPRIPPTPKWPLP